MNSEIAKFFDGYDEPLRQLVTAAVELVRETVPEASEEVDVSAKLVGFTFLPGTYKGLFVAVAPQVGYVNLMFARGAELQADDPAQLLEGTGKLARHIKIRRIAELSNPAVKALIIRAAELTPRT